MNKDELINYIKKLQLPGELESLIIDLIDKAPEVNQVLLSTIADILELQADFHEKVADVLTYGAHGSTFGGNPVACAAGCAVMEEINEKGLMIQAGIIGEYLKSKAKELQNQFPSVIKEVRGYGCMLGIDLNRNGQPVVDELLNRGILINCTNTTVLRLLPPFIITQEQCDQLMFELHSVLKSLK